MRLTWRLLVSLPLDAVPHGSDESLSVVLIDVEQLGVLNQAVGLSPADELIDTLATRLATWAGATALTAQLEGGRYAAVVPGLTAAELAQRADALRATLTTPVPTSAGPLSRDVHIGAAFDRAPQGSVEQLVLRADAALAATKLPGAARVRVWDSRLGECAARVGALELDLHEALRAGTGLQLHYQPAFDLRDGRLLGMEALARWSHPTLGLLGAERFINLVERSGLEDLLDAWALSAAFAQRAAWSRRHPSADFVLRVNLSPTQLADRALPDRVKRLLDAEGVDGALVGIEVTERKRAIDQAPVLGVLGELRALGLSIAIDDFGVAHSSPARLRTFPFDLLKIDQQFVRGVAQDTTNRFIVKAVVDLGALLHCRVVAEGVENAADAAALVELGCHRGQGHWLLPAAPPDALDDLVAHGRIELARL